VALPDALLTINGDPVRLAQILHDLLGNPAKYTQAGGTIAIGFNSAGLGIGLTVVRERVEAHGGTVTGMSEGHGTGSEFVVSLPLSG